ncbi:MAG: hypothetical protein ABSG77_10855 [Candidatus Acidiferrum sp.]|jgi:hypothetical protein
MNYEEASEMAAAELGPPADEPQNPPQEVAALGPPEEEPQNPLEEAAALGPSEEGPQNPLQEAAALGPSEEEPQNPPQEATATLGPSEEGPQNPLQEAAALGPSEEEPQNPLQEAAALGPPEEGPQNPPEEAAALGPSEEEPQGHPQKTSSPRKIAANRENSKHSTGPKTAEGKAKSAGNSLTHGIFAKQLLTGATPETAEEISTLVADIGEFFQPVGVIEELLAQKIAVEVARRARIVAFEQREVLRQNIFYSSVPIVDRLLRYSAAADRGLFRAIAELERLQVARKAQASSEDTASADPALPADEDDEPPSDHKD